MSDRRRKVISLAARVVLGGLLVLAGAHKLIRPHEFLGAVEWVEALGFPRDRLDLLTNLLPRLELLLGLCLILGLYLRPAFAATGLLLLVFSGTLLLGALGEGGIKACGCFGHEVLDSGGPLFWIGRNLVLLALAAGGFVAGRTAPSLDRAFG